MEKYFYRINHLPAAKVNNWMPLFLFLTEPLFESFVVQKLKQTYPPALDIAIQDGNHCLLSDLNLRQDKFRIRPGLLINTHDFTIVADNK